MLSRRDRCVASAALRPRTPVSAVGHHRSCVPSLPDQKGAGCPSTPPVSSLDFQGELGEADVIRAIFF